MVATFIGYLARTLDFLFWISYLIIIGLSIAIYFAPEKTSITKSIRTEADKLANKQNMDVRIIIWVSALVALLSIWILQYILVHVILFHLVQIILFHLFRIVT